MTKLWDASLPTMVQEMVAAVGVTSRTATSWMSGGAGSAWLGDVKRRPPHAATARMSAPRRVRVIGRVPVTD